MTPREYLCLESDILRVSIKDSIKSYVVVIIQKLIIIIMKSISKTKYYVLMIY